MNIIFFDDGERPHLLPFTFTRPCAELRIGILSIREKWMKYFQDSTYSYLTEPYLQVKYPFQPHSENLLLNGRVCPSQDLYKEIMALKSGEALRKGEELIAVLADEATAQAFQAGQRSGFQWKDAQAAYLSIRRVWDIFSRNGDAIRQDFELITRGRQSARLSSSNQVAGAENIFVEEGVTCEFTILNATTGPIYLGKDAEVMEGSMIRGPFALCEHAGTKMGAKIYGPTTIGPYCKAGGELNNVVMFAYSNKGHDGFLGNAVIGEWCNLGADTNNSNLKNNYQEVKIWDYPSERFVKTGLQFCGLMMGDYSKAGINTMFNTGTVVGVAANVFGAGFPRNFIPSFAWGGAQGFETFQMPKVYEMNEAMCARRNVEFSDADKSILQHIFDTTARNRFWENKK